MKIEKLQSIKDYEKACRNIANDFAEKYFGFDNISDFYWIGDDVGGVLTINDYHVDINFMIDALKLNCSKKKFFEWYDYTLDCAMEGRDEKIDFGNFIRFGFVNGIK